MITGIGFVPDAIRDGGGDVLWLVGLVMAVLSLYVLINKNWPRAARAVRLVVWFVWRWVVLLFPRAVWALWRQLCRDEHGVSRGPLNRLAEFLARRFVELVGGAVAPQFAEVADRSTRQHDEQNEVMRIGFAAVNERLDHGAQRMSGMTARLEALETRDEAQTRTVEIVDAVNDAAADK